MMHAEMGSTALWLMLLLGAYHGINPGHGMALRGGAGDAGAQGKCGGEGARPHRARPRPGHRQRGAGCGLSRHGAAARRHPLFRRRGSVGSGSLLPGAASPPALGPHAGGFPGPDSLVVPDGFGARRGFDGVAGAAGQQHGRSRRTKWRATITRPRASSSRRCSPPASIRQPILRSPGSSPGWFTAKSASRFFARPGSISTWFGPLRS